MGTSCNICCYINPMYATSVSLREECYKIENVSRRLLYTLYKWWFDNIAEIASRKTSRTQTSEVSQNPKIVREDLATFRWFPYINGGACFLMQHSQQHWLIIRIVVHLLNRIFWLVMKELKLKKNSWYFIYTYIHIALHIRVAFFVLVILFIYEYSKSRGTYSLMRCEGTGRLSKVVWFKIRTYCLDSVIPMYFYISRTTHTGRCKFLPTNLSRNRNGTEVAT